MPNRGKTIMYVDNSNMFRSLRALGWRIDAIKLFQKLQESGEIWQTHFFAAVSNPPRYKQTNFYNILKNQLHWETYIFSLGRKTCHCNQCGAQWTASTEKGVDVAIATSMLIHAYNKAFDTAILLSGDKDYFDTVKEIKKKGLRIEIVGFRQSMSTDLANESSRNVIFLDDLRADIELPTIEREVEELIETE
jgi:uncharacterized LabA/DUF88 family protein